MRRKHTEKIDTTFPVQCKVCTQEVRSKTDLKYHMVTHTYIYTENDKRKCEECNFIGNNDWTMLLHHGLSHSAPIECGLCQFEAKDIESLKIHLKTCETYECEKCEHVTKSIKDMKKHIVSSAECGSSTVFHIKIDRNDENEANWKEYIQDEIF